MATEIKVPVLPESVSDAVIATWHKKAGDSVRRDENLLDLETDNGAIEADGIDADEVSARTDNGRIRLAFDTAPSTVEALTDNGAIVIRLPDDGERYDVSATSDNGHVDVDIATGDGANRRVVADSDNGAIDIEYLNGAD